MDPENCKFTVQVSNGWQNASATGADGKAASASQALVSFIIPVYSRGGNYLPQCLDSVLRAAENYGNAEILILNDRSPDDSAEVIARYAARFPNVIRVIPSQHRLGQAAARAALVNASRGKYVIPCDHDDVVLDFDLAASVAFLERHGDYCGSFACKYFFSNRGFERHTDGGAVSVFQLLVAPKLIVNTAILRREDVLNAGNFASIDRNDPGMMAEDVYLMIRMCLRKKFRYEPFAPRTLYRVHPDQISKCGTIDWENTHRRLIDRVIAPYQATADLIGQGKLPPVTPENDRIVTALLGVTAFRHLNDLDFALNCCRAALDRHPDDYGIWLMLLKLATVHDQKKLWEQTFQDARERFDGDLSILRELAFAEINWYRSHGGEAPAAVLKRAKDLSGRFNALPVSIADHPLLKRS